MPFDCFLQETPPFPGFLGKSSQDKHPKSTPFPEIMGTHMRPLNAFEGVDFSQSIGVQNRLLMSEIEYIRLRYILKLHSQNLHHISRGNDEFEAIPGRGAREESSILMMISGLRRQG